MGLSSLDAALSGLRVSQQKLSVISNNVANVGTEGYTRKILPQSSQAIEGVTVGVLSGVITRNVDLNLTRDLWTQVSATSELSVQSRYLERVEQFHGPPDAELSIAAELGRLRDGISALANSPEDVFLQAQGVNQAVDLANKINDFSQLISTARNDAQDEIRQTVDSINDLMTKIAELNKDIISNINIGRSTAQLEDVRDQAVKDLSELISITSFKRGDGALIIQTSRGEELVGVDATPLFFAPTPLSATVYYPNQSNPNLNGIFVRNPNDTGAALDITQQDIGGKLGGLIEVRDEIFPRQQAQLDELAHKIALRFEAQGLRLFTNAAGTVPLDTPPDETAGPPPTAVTYVGFSGEFQVNQNILDDNSLMQSGTYGASIPSGSNEVLRRVLEFTFGDVNYQEAVNPTLSEAIDLQSAGATPLQQWLGLLPSNTVRGTADLTSYTSVADMVTTLGPTVFGPSPGAETDRFDITFSDPDFGGGPYTVTVDLRAVPSLGTNAADDLVNFITADPAWAGAVADYGATLSIGADGQLVFGGTSNISFAASGAEPLSTSGFAALGLSASTHTAIDPYFDVQVGNNESRRITLDPTTTAADLLTALNGVPGLVAQYNAAEGFLQLRPGNDFTAPDFGGDIKLTGGPFTTDGSATYVPGTGNVRAAVDTGVGVISALFGTYSITGGVVSNASPVQSFEYESQVSATDTTLVPFRTQFLGPNVGRRTGIAGVKTLVEYAQKMVNKHTQELILTNNRIEDSQSLQEILQTQLSNESGVNLDEELSNLIVVQTAFSAAARVVNAVDEIFDELLAAVR